MSSPNTLWQVLKQAGPDRIAIVADGGVRLSYGELRDQVRATADLFRTAGIRPGCRIATALPNGVPAVVCFLAATIAGTAAPLNPAYRRDEFAFFLEDTSAKLLVLPPAGNNEASAAADGKIPIVTVELEPSGRLKFSSGARRASSGDPSPEQVALVLHTSGTTGRPKRVPLNHQNLSASACVVADTYRLGPDDVTLGVMPLFHVHGLVASVLATFMTGGTIVIPAKFDPFNFWRTAEENRATWFTAVPAIHQMLLARAARTNERPAGAAHLRFIRSCSSALLPDVMRQVEETFGVPVLQAYGMTEASHQMASNPLPPASRRPGSVGPATGAEISVVDAEGNHLPSGQPGEVAVRGAGVMKGYENNEETNARSFTNGWFRTGDQGVLDGERYLRLTGRLKEMINRGGEKISPLEIDEVLLSHPAVAEAVSFGVKHPVWGEEAAAAVVLRQPVSEKELIGHCRARLAEYKYPRKIHLVESIPRTATGKIQRGAVAAAFADAKH